MRNKLHCLLALMILGGACGSDEKKKPDPEPSCKAEYSWDCDMDQDGFTPVRGDCNDNDPDIYPGAPECPDGQSDGIDNDCDDLIDDGCLDADADGDGATGETDCNDNNSEVGPYAFEVPANGRDDNCNGEIDEVDTCDCDGPLGSDSLSFAHAIGLCHGEIQEHSLEGADRSRDIVSDFGIYEPLDASCRFIILSTGVAGDRNLQGDFYDGTDFDLVHTPNPAKYEGNPYNEMEPSKVYDYSDLKATLRVPPNARAFAFDFIYLTSEYPEFSCSRYNDTFVALLESEQFNGNISFDALGNTIQLNTALFMETDASEMRGTGYDETSWECESLGQREDCEKPHVGFSCPVGGSTGWLTTTAPVTPDETIKLTFAIFDEGDGAYDSMVIIDNFRWKVTAPAGPCTGPDCPP